MTELRLAVEPPTTYYDEPFALQLDGVPEGETVAVAAEVRELDGSVWRSAGDHRVGPSGCLEDPMRVVWSGARPAGGGAGSCRAGDRVELTVEHRGRTAGASCVRLDPSVGEGVEPDDPQLVGLLFRTARRRSASARPVLGRG